MAEIGMRRRPASFWPWVAGIGVLVLVVLALMVMFRADDEQVAAESEAAAAGEAAVEHGAAAGATTPGAAADADPVAAFRTAVGALAPGDAADPARLQELLDRLAAAVEVVGAAAPQRAASLGARADSARLGDWRLPRQLLLVREAFDDAAAVLIASAEQGTAGVRPAAAEAASSAGSRVTTERPLDTQDAEIAAFLQRVADALDGVRGARGATRNAATQ